MPGLWKWGGGGREAKRGGDFSNLADKGRTRSPGWKSEFDKFNLEISQQPEQLKAGGWGGVERGLGLGEGHGAPRTAACRARRRLHGFLACGFCPLRRARGDGGAAVAARAAGSHRGIEPVPGCRRAGTPTPTPIPTGAALGWTPVSPVPSSSTAGMGPPCRPQGLGCPGSRERGWQPFPGVPNIPEDPSPKGKPRSQSWFNAVGHTRWEIASRGDSVFL